MPEHLKLEINRRKIGKRCFDRRCEPYDLQSQRNRYIEYQNCPQSADKVEKAGKGVNKNIVDEIDPDAL